MKFFLKLICAMSMVLAAACAPKGQAKKKVSPGAKPSGVLDCVAQANKNNDGKNVVGLDKKSCVTKAQCEEAGGEVKKNKCLPKSSGDTGSTDTDTGDDGETDNTDSELEAARKAVVEKVLGHIEQIKDDIDENKEKGITADVIEHVTLNVVLQPKNVDGKNVESGFLNMVFKMKLKDSDKIVGTQFLEFDATNSAVSSADLKKNERIHEAMPGCLDTKCLKIGFFIEVEGEGDTIHKVLLLTEREAYASADGEDNSQQRLAFTSYTVTKGTETLPVHE